MHGYNFRDHDAKKKKAHFQHLTASACSKNLPSCHRLSVKKTVYMETKKQRIYKLLICYYIKKTATRLRQHCAQLTKNSD